MTSCPIELGGDNDDNQDNEDDGEDNADEPDTPDTPDTSKTRNIVTIRAKHRAMVRSRRQPSHFAATSVQRVGKKQLHSRSD